MAAQSCATASRLDAGNETIARAADARRRALVVRTDESPPRHVLVGLVRDRLAGGGKKLLDVAVKVADAALKYDAGDVGMLIASMDIYLLAGNKGKAAELGQKALAAAENEMEKKQIQMIVDEKLKAEEKK